MTLRWGVVNSSKLGNDWRAEAHLPPSPPPQGTTHHMVAVYHRGEAGALTCIWCGRTDVTTQQICEKAPK